MSFAKQFRSKLILVRHPKIFTFTNTICLAKYHGEQHMARVYFLRPYWVMFVWSIDQNIHTHLVRWSEIPETQAEEVTIRSTAVVWWAFITSSIIFVCKSSRTHFFSMVDKKLKINIPANLEVGGDISNTIARIFCAHHHHHWAMRGPRHTVIMTMVMFRMNFSLALGEAKRKQTPPTLRHSFE